MTQSRRNFLRDSVCGLTAAALVSSLDKLNLVNAMVQEQPDVASDYRALVCIFLFGGNDCNNTIVPLDSEYNSYAAVRNASGLAIPQASLLPLPNSTGGGGRPFGMHPNLSPEVANPALAKGLLDVWNAQKLAVLFNTGTLVQPLTRAQYLAGAAKPYQLFSHSDQTTQQQTSISKTVGQTGWGGRVADLTGALNGSVALPMNISLSGTSLFATGVTTRQLAISSAGTLASVLVLNWNGVASANPNTIGSSYRSLLGMDLNSFLVKGASDTTNSALTADAALNQPDPTLTAVFPNTSLGNQLKQIAKLIKIRDNAGITMRRQIFFAALGNFDTHTNQTSAALAGAQGNNFTQLSQAMRAFYDEMVAQGISDKVTTFTQSDFGRTLQPSGSGAASVGSDHAWGNHALVMGGSVLGRAFYGTYPVLALGGPDDTDNRGRWIPTTAVDQYAATLASWYGLAPADLPTVFPNLSKFPSQNLGFLG
ncbi:MAG TPA: DUF1501 domain-containing protein [Pyrinomonadaceae bacterium]|jgi:uncharacterized protein (DUF1501 family)|nr:DUF1501 domain-containing protein [Pyrinomonadaceae bacterium]